MTSWKLAVSTVFIRNCFAFSSVKLPGSGSDDQPKSGVHHLPEEADAVTNDFFRWFRLVEEVEEMIVIGVKEVAIDGLKLVRGEKVDGGGDDVERLRREVGDDNLVEDIVLIRQIVDDYPYIAMDIEFPVVVL
ncbi:hypothetical protein L1987_30814 [Smallanthus sonchifolius]|uniref:Uncharacterized protein n=1 Tax=Smallanthus sonchifolius TaxID=185202 RepID=A0ACB9I369_9ASTR|nr:hypothetical protein L1987_30814 [Smallanthus sonchifolius]